MDEGTNPKFIAKIVNIKITPRPHAWNPPTDLLETEDSFMIRVEIAGVKVEDITISLEDDAVTIIGRRLLGDKKCAYHRMEIPYGDFRTRVDLPADVDYASAIAEYENGFLSVMLPKSKPRQVKISSGKEN